MAGAHAGNMQGRGVRICTGGHGVWTMTEGHGLLGFSGTRDVYSGLILKGATNCKGTENMVLN